MIDNFHHLGYCSVQTRRMSKLSKTYLMRRSIPIKVRYPNFSISAAEKQAHWLVKKERG
jgi:hypothetical protein